MGKYVLIVEDEPDLAGVCRECLEQYGFRTRRVANGSEALKAIAAETPDAVLLDLGLPDIDGMKILKKLREENIECAVVIMTGQTSLNTAVDAMREGADDFVAKPFDPERLQVSVANALERRRLSKLLRVYEATGREEFCDFTGKSPEMQAAYRVIESAARTTAPVLITGESGTGKELAAQAIHVLSPRKARTLVALNCAAIPHDLLESEIFGHVKGAFTGAVANRMGAAKQADGGTLFLDELGEMPMQLQSKLLRFVQTGTYTPVGANAPQKADIRFICATNRNPLEAVQQGKLREDLYYRMNVISLVLPPLREREDDVLLLARTFLDKFTRQEKKKFASLSDNAKALLLRHKWPGNVRELENAIRSAVVLHDGAVLEANMLKIAETHAAPPSPSDPARQIRPMAEVEHMAIASAIEACNGNISEAARRLAISPSTIHRKLKEWT